MQTSEITVIGSVNIDIHGAPSGRYLPEDSNPGTISMTVGGVGCNIARSISLLGHRVRFISAVADDALSRQAKAAMDAAALDYSQSVFVCGGRTSSYLYITDETGSMVSAVSDMSVTQALTPEALAERSRLFDPRRPVVFDANLSGDSIRYLAENCPSPLIADSVSAAKAARLRCALDRLSMLKCNGMEAIELTGAKDAGDAAKMLADKGIGRVFITLGERGVLCADRRGTQFVPGFRAPFIVNSTGAGDSFLAGAVHMTLKGAEMYETARFAAAVAACTCTAEEPVHPELSEEFVVKMFDNGGIFQ